MEYLKINDIDFSTCVNALTIEKNKIYVAENNANGDTIADYINSKRIIKVGIIPLDNTEIKKLLTAIDALNVSLSFMNPLTGIIENNVNCIIPTHGVEYYTIQQGNITFKAFTLTFNEM